MWCLPKLSVFLLMRSITNFFNQGQRTRNMYTLNLDSPTSMKGKYLLAIKKDELFLDQEDWACQHVENQEV